MSYKVEITAYFKKQAKHLLKKYPSLKSELEDVITHLEIEPTQGTPIGNNCYKIRLAIRFLRIVANPVVQGLL